MGKTIGLQTLFAVGVYAVMLLPLTGYFLTSIREQGPWKVTIALCIVA